jgi:hypothetical protein
MTEPKRTDPERTPGSPDDRDRAARIEELLVSGLDHYFAADYEQAINIWTRVVFLERDHDRARAYIERARGAIAERQRESEELLQRGVAAYRSGDATGARDLLLQAVDRGAPSDEALVLLDRLDRLDGTGFDAPLPHGSAPIGTLPIDPDAKNRPLRRGRRILIAALGLAVGVGVVLGGLAVRAWFLNVPAAILPTTVATEPLPVVRTADMELDRARSYYGGGHLYDALHLLDRIPSGDPIRPEADRLKGDIQRDLLTAASLSPSESPERGGAR